MARAPARPHASSMTTFTEHPASTEQPTPDQAEAASPDQIMQIAFGFMAAKHLFAASELGIFEALA